MLFGPVLEQTRKKCGTNMALSRAVLNAVAQVGRRFWPFALKRMAHFFT